MIYVGSDDAEYSCLGNKVGLQMQRSIASVQVLIKVGCPGAHDDIRIAIAVKVTERDEYRRTIGKGVASRGSITVFSIRQGDKKSIGASCIAEINEILAAIVVEIDMIARRNGSLSGSIKSHGLGESCRAHED